MSYISLKGLTVAIAGLLAMGLETIEAHATSLATRLVEELDGTGWTPFRSIKDKAATTHIITLGYPSGGVEDTIKALRDANIICSNRNNRIRISLAHFNDENDVRSLVQVLRQGTSL